MYQLGITKRRRFIRPRGRYPVYRGSTRYTRRPLGNPLALTERKYHDIELYGRTIVQVPDPGSWNLTNVDPYGPNPIGGGPILAQCFNAIPLGYTWQQRVGRKVQIVNMKLHLEIGTQASTINPAQAETSQLVRIIIYIDKQTNGAQSNPGDVLYSGPSNTVPIQYFQNGSSFGRYKMLFDRKYMFHPNTVYNYSSTNILSNGVNKNIDITFNFNPPLTVHYNAGIANTVADIIDNSIHMAAGCDNNIPGCFISYKGRLTYFDA